MTTTDPPGNQASRYTKPLELAPAHSQPIPGPTGLRTRDHIAADSGTAAKEEMAGERHTHLLDKHLVQITAATTVLVGVFCSWATQKICSPLGPHTLQGQQG